MTTMKNNEKKDRNMRKTPATAERKKRRRIAELCINYSFANHSIVEFFFVIVLFSEIKFSVSLP